jgi:hypothetical protein
MRKGVRSAAVPNRISNPGFNPVLQHALWLMPLLLFLVFRLFGADTNYLLAGDQCTFLELGRTFPKHALYNHEIYLIHPPLLGYAIGLFHLVLPLFTAGLVASLAFAGLNFLALRELALFEGLPPGAVAVGLVYLATSRPAVAYDFQVARVSILVCTTTISLLCFVRLLKHPSRKAFFYSIAANVVCLLVSDQALFLLPCQTAILWFRGSWPDRKWLYLAAASLAAAMLWPAIRLFEFWRRSDLPAGIDGTIEFTKNFPLLALVQPNFLPFTNTHRSFFTQTSLSLSNLDPLLLLRLPFDVLILPRILSVILILGLIALALARTDSRRRMLLWLSLSIFCLIPVGLGMNEYYGMAFITPFTLVIIEGAAVSIDWSRQYVPLAAIAAVSLACALGVVFWLTAPKPPAHYAFQPNGGSQFLFTRQAVTRGTAISRFFASLPRDTGVMTVQGFTPELVYLTDKRVVAIPFDPNLLDRFIAEYRISYLVVSSEQFPMEKSLDFDRYTSHLVTRYIVKHPERYRPVASVHEVLPDFYYPFDYYVFAAQPTQPATADSVSTTER